MKESFYYKESSDCILCDKVYKSNCEKQTMLLWSYLDYVGDTKQPRRQI